MRHRKFWAQMALTIKGGHNWLKKMKWDAHQAESNPQMRPYGERVWAVVGGLLEEF